MTMRHQILKTFFAKKAESFHFLKHISFLKNKSGIAAVEFAMTVPIMIALYMGTVEFGQALTIDRKMTAVASSTADLVAQSQQITSGEIQDIFEISRAIMSPYDTTTLKVTLSSVLADSNNDQAVSWSVSSSTGSEHAVGSTIPGMPVNVTEANTSVIVAEVEYVYTSPIAYYITGSRTLRDTFYLRPRTSMEVELN